MANFYLVCGIGGGGKTILSKQIVAKNPGIVFMDADMRCPPPARRPSAPA